MKYFAEIVERLELGRDHETQARELEDYLSVCAPANRRWALELLGGIRPPALLTLEELRTLVLDYCGVADWMAEQCRSQTGDLREVLALILPEPARELPAPSLHIIMAQLISLKDSSKEEQKAFILRTWGLLGYRERHLFFRILSGGFRKKLARRQLIPSFARALGLSPLWLIGYLDSKGRQPWKLDELDKLNEGASPRPFYGFQEAGLLKDHPRVLGPAEVWQAEAHWPGNRCQLIRDKGSRMLWSLSLEFGAEEIATGGPSDPDIPEDSILDGIWPRYSRDPESTLPSSFPRYQSFDLLRLRGRDLRALPQSERRDLLRDLTEQNPGTWLRLSPLLEFSCWEELMQGPAGTGQGLVLKKREAPYLECRDSRNWLLWPGPRKRMITVLTDLRFPGGPRGDSTGACTFSVQDGSAWVPVARLDPQWSSEQMEQILSFAREHTRERFGPVRLVEPSLVFELSFDKLLPSRRHKAGFRISEPLVGAWVRDIPLPAVTQLNQLKEWVEKLPS